MNQTSKLLQAAAALSAVLSNSGVPHAFHGNFLAAVLADNPQSDEIFCIVEGRNAHPFRRVREALSKSTDFTAVNSPWTNRLHTTYRCLTPLIEIEFLPAGEEGPRHLDATTVTTIRGVPFLTVSEFVRAKMKTWAIRRSEGDAQDIIYVMTRYWNVIDINRINEQDMHLFISRNPAAATAWMAVKKKYRMGVI